jgi:small subunit ribosomal protein S4e
VSCGGKGPVEDGLISRLSNIFVIGEGNKPLVSLPKGKGVKLSIAGAFGVLLSFVS